MLSLGGGSRAAVQQSGTYASGRQQASLLSPGGGRHAAVQQPGLAAPQPSPAGVYASSGQQVSLLSSGGGSHTTVQQPGVLASPPSAAGLEPMHRLADPGPFNVDLMAHSVRKMFDPALPVTSEYLDDAGLTMMMGLVQTCNVERRRQGDAVPNCQLFDSLYVSQKFSSDYTPRSTERYLNKHIDHVLSKDLLIIPVHVVAVFHWAVACVDVKQKQLHYLDSCQVCQPSR